MYLGIRLKNGNRNIYIYIFYIIAHLLFILLILLLVHYIHVIFYNYTKSEQEELSRKIIYI